MSNAEIMPAPEFLPIPVAGSKWEREWDAFVHLEPSLIATHSGKYVAVHEGRVVDSGEDQIEVAMRAYAKYGYTPIYVGLVSTEAPTLIRIPSPRIHTVKE